MCVWNTQCVYVEHTLRVCVEHTAVCVWNTQPCVMSVPLTSMWNATVQQNGWFVENRQASQTFHQSINCGRKSGVGLLEEGRGWSGWFGRHRLVPRWAESGT